MAFDQTTFALVGAHSANTPKLYSYKTNDTSVEVLAADYFLDKRFQLSAGDVILASISSELSIITVTASSSSTVTTSVSVVEAPAKQVTVNAKSDLPAPSGGVITLDSEIDYVAGDDFSLGTDRVVMSADTVFRGIDENVITITYTGTGDMFTASDVSCRLKGFTANAVNGTFINALNTAGNEGTSNVIIEQVDFDVKNLGTIENLNILGVFRTAANTITGTGWVFTGTAGNATSFNDNTVTQSAGTYLDLGTATFLSFDVNNYLMVGGAGTKFLDGAVSSGNIRTGGLGRVIRGRDFGSETILTGITTSDALWEFDLNDKIADTRPDGLLSLQANAAATTIGVAGTPVLVAGTWVVERSSQFTGTTGGRLTYDGGKDATLPITGSFTVEPVSGGAVNVSIEVAIDGVVVPNSKRTGNTSSGNPTSITIPWQEVFSTTQFIEYFVTNEDTTVNVLVSSGTGRVN